MFLKFSRDRSKPWCSGAEAASSHHVQAWVAASDAEDTAAHHLDDFPECADTTDEFTDLELRTRELDDIYRWVGGQYPASGATHQSGGGVDLLRRQLQFDQQQFPGERVAAGHIL